MKKIDKRIVLPAFFLLVIFAILSICKIFSMYPYHFNIKGLKKTLEPITINFELNEKISAQDMFVCFEQTCATLYSDNNRNIYYYKFNYSNEYFFSSKVKNIKIAYPAQYKNLTINTIYLNVGNKNYYYSKDEISKFIKEITKIQNYNNAQNNEYNAVYLPEINNYKGVVNHITVLFLSLFSNWTIFIIPYFWLLIAYLLYLYHKEYFKFIPQISSHTSIFVLIMFLGIFLRLQDINYFPLWADELYAKIVTSQSLSAVFHDAGNPPLFYFLEYITSKIFSNDVLSLRLFPFIFGIASIIMIYLIFKNISQKTALFASFLASINTIFIYGSQEAKGYSLFGFLVLFAIYVLFKYTKNPNGKNLLIYSVATFLLINANYYLLVLAFSNFIWVLVSLLQTKNYKKILSFIPANLFCLLTFIPYFIGVRKLAISEAFNAWIPKLNYENIFNIIDTYFFNKYLFIFLIIVVLINLVICLIPQTNVNEYKRKLYIYLFYSITTVITILCIISIFIKPIIEARLILSIYMLIFMLEILTIIPIIKISNLSNNLKACFTIYFVVLLGIYLNVTYPQNAKESCTLDNLMFIIQNEALQYHNKGYEIYALIPDYTQYSKAFPDIEKLKFIKWYATPSNSGKKQIYTEINKHIKTKNKAVVFVSPIGMQYTPMLYFDKRIHIYNTDITPSIKIILE